MKEVLNQVTNTNKLFAAADNKIGDHDHVTGIYGGSSHWRCNINFKFN